MKLRATLAAFLLLSSLGWAAPYKDPSGRFEYLPPPSWAHDKGRESWSNTSNSAAFNVRVIATSESRLESWAGRVVTTHRERWDNVEQINMLLDGQKAKRIRGSKVARGHTTSLELVLSVKGKTGVVLTFVTQRGEDPSFANVMNGVTKSFHWH